MREISDTAVASLNLLHNEQAWLECWEFQIDDSTSVCIVNNPTTVRVDGTNYEPFPISRAEIRETLAGVVQELVVTVSAVDQAIVALLESGDLIDKRVKLTLANEANLAASDAIVTTFRIIAASTTDTTVTLRLGQHNLLDVQVPKVRAIRSRCRHVYGGAFCGYDTTRAGAIATCDYTLDGANGCTVHGDDEVDAGLPRRHPLRFGGFPGILRGPIA